MIIHTIQMAQWRKAKELGIELIDTTIKSGESAFAPTWEMVRSWKAGRLGEAEYHKQYIALMRESFHTHRALWEDLLAKERFALACYCKADSFCHRLILKEMLIWLVHQRHLPLIDGGEIY